MSAKRLSYLTESIRKIESDRFDESSIRLLLIEIRDYLKRESFLYEACHFIAHPNRDQGICHKTVNSRHAKMKMYEDELDKQKANGFFETDEFKNGSEWDFSTKMLGYMKTRKVEKKLFKILILDGIDDAPEDYLIEHFKKNRKKLKAQILKAYKLVGQHYVLSPAINGKSYEFIDELLKFIRGAIHARAVITQSELEQQLEHGIKKVCNQNKIKVDIVLVKSHLQGVTLCIMAILHESTFTLYDKSIAKAYLCLNQNTKNRTDYTIGLFVNAERFSFSLFSSEINAADYLELGQDKLDSYNMTEMPYVHAVRNESGQLELRKYDLQHHV